MPVDASDSASTFEEHEGFAGKELLAQMKLRDISMPVVVITQYKAFAKGTVDLRELTAECAREFPGIFQGAIYYSTSVESWKRELFEIINRI
ncbi:hypothetical protein [Burkholderia sp. Bp9031]|uniref:hypothetical protein n=1 Tax=Burkholderia sp. Bp9031 TaxID=2184566 RepID=UPI00163981C7|nr:hypothetical protein [Burkholderia sp. Bp9031]